MCLSGRTAYNTCTISGLRQEVDENCDPRCYYSTIILNFVQTVRDNLLVHLQCQLGFKWVLKMGPICCPETSVINYHLGQQSPLNMGQRALFRNVGNKLPLMPKIHMKWTNMLSPFISKILPLSVNVTWRCDRRIVPKLLEGTTTKSQTVPSRWEIISKRRIKIHIARCVITQKKAVPFSTIFDKIK